MELTEDEAAVYDRQLRVWGVETQRKCGIPCPWRNLTPRR